MKQIKRQTRKLFVAIVIFSMLAIYGSVPYTQAVTMQNASATVSDSDRAVAATYTMQFTPSADIPATGDILVTFDAAIDLTGVVAGDVTCPTGSTGKVVGVTTIECTYGGGLSTTTAQTLSVANIVNPDPGVSNPTSYRIEVQTRNATNVEIEKAIMRVAIIDDVNLYVTVEPTLEFSIAGTSTGAVINGSTMTATSTDLVMSFGTMEVGTSSIMGQRLSVITNADDGFTVTVEQNQNLTYGVSDIDGLQDTALASYTTNDSPQNWNLLPAILDDENSYGTFGYTTNDATLSATGDGVARFNGGKWASIATNDAGVTDKAEVFFHDGPADGLTDDKGTVDVAYRIDINALQEAGDYESILTYICTATY